MSPQATHTSAWPRTSLGVPMIPLRFNNLLLLHRTQKKTILKITGLLEYNSGTTQWKRLIGQGMKAQSFHALSGHHTLPAHKCVHQPPKPQHATFFQGFIE